MVAKQNLKPAVKTLPPGKLKASSHAKGMVKGSVYKAKRVLDAIRGLPIEEASNFLYFSSLAQSEPIAKLLKSAAANAHSQGEVSDLRVLRVRNAWATPATPLRRFRAAPRGRVRRIKKRFSRVYIELGTEH
jgi:large subunit ribosomal protein L22